MTATPQPGAPPPAASSPADSAAAAPAAAHDSIFRSTAHGPLPGLLLLLTVVTGAVDAVSILRLGRVFVANMTGNVVFIGFSLAGAPGFALGSSLTALAGFLVGAAIGGQLVAHLRTDRAILLRAAVALEFVLTAIALVIAISVSSLTAPAGRYSLAALLAIAMGIQNAAARSLAVPDLTTTVLTMTLTGIAADIRDTGWRGPALWRRLLAVATMLGGACAGAALVLHTGSGAALALPTAILGAVTVAAAATVARDRGHWRFKP
jgi:uncharacterized membrane protein YoaK (UPF0700 family)